MTHTRRCLAIYQRYGKKLPPGLPREMYQYAMPLPGGSALDQELERLDYEIAIHVARVKSQGL